MIHGAKNTLIVCLTVLVSCVLFISYNEYTNRYALVATKDNSLYIFDKRSTVLNRCSEKGCQVIETKLPSKVFFPLMSDSSPSKLFDSQKNMVDELAKTEAVKSEKNEEELKSMANINMQKQESQNLGETANAVRKDPDNEFVE
ncbi:MAG: hypothetical protein LBJ92_03940 [Holosporales bacterium]|nr:hypothetical protein [Holosporales bacterium]